MLPIPDLLSHEPRLDLDTEQLHELMGLAFTGRGDATALDDCLANPVSESPWRAEHFERDLFVRELVESQFHVTAGGSTYQPNVDFLVRTLTRLPRDLETIAFRQSILRELWSDPTRYRQTLRLYTRLYDLVNLFKIPGRQARLDIDAFRLDLFRLVRATIDSMATEFADAESGLRRLADAGKAIQESEEYATVRALLAHADEHASLNVDLKVGASGGITDLAIRRVDFDRANPFHLSTPRRWWEKTKAVLWHGMRLHDESILSRLVGAVYDQLATPLMSLAQLLGHLEIYLAQHQLRERVEARGLSMSLAEVSDAGPLVFENLFNPLLLDQVDPVPCTVRQADARSVTLITGPNSGGKTRLLQSLGLAQLLGQNGFYSPAASARFVLVRGLFVSLIEHEAVEHSEGRLGRELERIRAMFDAIEAPSMVILDELCSGTNPSEGEEVFSLVLRLLERVRPVVFVTTHFLD
ncbi:MAG: DNA mismatch repair protein, partial [Acidobacteriota bacterium]